MAKLTIILLLSILPVSHAFGQLPDCLKFREGKFRIADTQAGVVTIAERKGMYQTESSESLKLVARFRIAWQDNCNFTLKLAKIIRNENRIELPVNLEIRVKITGTSADSYTQEVSSSITNGSYQVKAVKIN